MSTILERIVADKAQDEAAWLAARRQGVTATEVAQLEKNGAGYRQTLLHEKRNGERNFFGNAYTAWGLEREPVIAEWVQKTFGHWPSDALIHAPNNVRHLATPDGLYWRDGIITIAEIKTSKHWLEPGTEAFLQSPYMAQVQWQMMVADVMECLFVWEVREGQPGDFKPGQRGHAWIERDQGHIDELVMIADQFLEELDNGSTDDPADYAELVRERVEIDRRIGDLQEKRSRVDAQIIDRIGGRDAFSIATEFGKVSWSTPKPSQRFDATGFKSAQPDLYKQFVKSVQAKPSLRITPLKGVDVDVF